MGIFKSKHEKKKDAFVKMAGEFALQGKNKDALIIMGDPETDVLVACYKGLITAVHRKRSIDVVRNLVEFNRDTRDGALLNQFIQDLTYMVVGLGDAAVNEREMKRGLAKARVKAEKAGMPMAVFGRTNEKGNTEEMIAIK